MALKTTFKYWLARKTADCKTVSPLFSDAYERKLSLFERLRVRLHLYTCGACLNYVSNLEFMHDVFRAQDASLEREKIQASLSPESKERLKQALKSAE